MITDGLSTFEIFGESRWIIFLDSNILTTCGITVLELKWVYRYIATYVP
jgi:hypothetical protein